MGEYVRDKNRKAGSKAGDRAAIERQGVGVSVLTVDDQAVFRRVAHDVIVATLGFEPIGEVASGEEAVSAVEQLRPDLVLLDVRMPGIGGIEAARRITSAHPDTVVVLVSIEEPDEVEHAVRGSGAATLVRKQDFGPSLLRRLWAEHAGTS
jgi:two-component system, NarL family, invasion response regulator UvrY